MARVRKPLKMADGHVIQHIDEFKEHFDLENMLGHYESGRLAAWLESYFYDDEVETLKSLDREAADFQEKFCKLFGVEYENPVDQAKIVEREKRLIKLKGLTADEMVHQHVDYVAFDQGELADRLDEGCTEIYLCSADGRKFTVPASHTGVKYIGVNNPQAHISGKQADPLGIEFEGMSVDNLAVPPAKEQTLDRPVPKPKDSSDQSLDKFRSRLRDLRNYRVSIITNFNVSYESKLSAIESESFKSESDCRRAAERALEKAYNPARQTFEKRTAIRSAEGLFATAKKELTSRMDSMKDMLTTYHSKEMSKLITEINKLLSANKLFSEIETEYDSLKSQYEPDGVYCFTSAIEYNKDDPSEFEEGLAKLFAKGFCRYGYDTYPAASDIERHFSENLKEMQDAFNEMLVEALEEYIIDPIEDILLQIHSI